MKKKFDIGHNNRKIVMLYLLVLKSKKRKDMKKILFLFLMVMGLMSSLYALDTGQVGCDVQKSQTLSEIDGVLDIPSDVTFVKVNILHRDTLMYNLHSGTRLNKKMMEISGYRQNINISLTSVAVVCYPRGGFGA